MIDPGETAAGGAEGAARTLRQKERVGTILRKGPRKRNPEGATDLSAWAPTTSWESLRAITEAQNLRGILCFFRFYFCFSQTILHKIGGSFMSELKRTTLYDAHVAAGAVMVDFGGWEMPIQ